jgi:flagellar assembly protein FliH
MSNRIAIGARPNSVNLRFKNVYEEDIVNLEKESQMLQQKIHDEEMQRNYDSGFSEGYDAAKLKFEEEYQIKLTEKYIQLDHLLDSVNTRMLKHEELFENKVLDFSFFIAEKIVRREILRESIINESLKESIKKVLGANNVIIKLNQEDLDILSDESQKVLNNGSFSRIAFEADNRIDIGGCIVETEIGNVDARIPSQLNEIKKVLGVLNSQDEA